jgi:hypothetical protein
MPQNKKQTKNTSGVVQIIRESENMSPAYKKNSTEKRQGHSSAQIH